MAMNRLLSGLWWAMGSRQGELQSFTFGLLCPFLPVGSSWVPTEGQNSRQQDMLSGVEAEDIAASYRGLPQLSWQG